jgi:hypothetical protein
LTYTGLHGVISHNTELLIPSIQKVPNWIPTADINIFKNKMQYKICQHIDNESPKMETDPASETSYIPNVPQTMEVVKHGTGIIAETKSRHERLKFFRYKINW